MHAHLCSKAHMETELQTDSALLPGLCAVPLRSTCLQASATRALGPPWSRTVTTGLLPFYNIDKLVRNLQEYFDLCMLVIF